METWRELLAEFQRSDAEACKAFDCNGLLNKENVEERVAFLEAEWLRIQSLIGLMLTKLAAGEASK